MKRAAFGIRMHSGWGILVVATGSAEIIDRRRIAVISDDMNSKHRGNQPYHYAAELGLPSAEKFLADYTAATDQLARAAIANAIRELKIRKYQITAAALLLASGRKLPPLPQILASHPMIHTAEGEFFRETVRRACESIGLPVTGYRERELEDCAQTILAGSCSKLLRQIAAAGKSLGPPWTADHKSAALAACLALNAKRAAKA